jgi:small subunit ribosomal protein S18
MPKARRPRPTKDTREKPRRKKVNVLVQERVDYVDYKDVDLLQRFLSDRAKIRPRRVSGNDPHQQREIAIAIKNAREMGLLPYTKRVATRGGGRGERGGGRGERGGRSFEASDDRVETPAAAAAAPSGDETPVTADAASE